MILIANAKVSIVTFRRMETLACAIIALFLNRTLNIAQSFGKGMDKGAISVHNPDFIFGSNIQFIYSLHQLHLGDCLKIDSLSGWNLGEQIMNWL
jgi:hypothetical protein